jgi:hypothetical protein
MPEETKVLKLLGERIDKLHQSGLVKLMVVVSLPDMMKPATLM